MIKKVKSKEINVDFVIESYNSSMDVVRDCKTRKITDSSFDNMQDGSLGGNGKRWCGVDSYEQALQFLEEGYQPTVEKLKAGIKANLQGNGKRISFHNDIVGYAPIVSLAILGVPNSMINSKMKPIKAKVIDIYYNMTASSGTSSQSIIDAGVKMLSAIIALEQQGYRFNLYAVQNYYNGWGSNKKCYMLKVKVKDAMQPIDLKRISFPLTHTGFFRVVGFDWYSKCPEAKYMSGYGKSIDYDFDRERMTKASKELFGDNAVWFGCVKIMDKNEEYIKEVLINAGNKKSVN
jgi:hypothetical protein